MRPAHFARGISRGSHGSGGCCGGRGRSSIRAGPSGSAPPEARENEPQQVSRKSLPAGHALRVRLDQDRPLRNIRSRANPRVCPATGNGNLSKHNAGSFRSRRLRRKGQPSQRTEILSPNSHLRISLSKLLANFRLAARSPGKIVLQTTGQQRDGGMIAVALESLSCPSPKEWRLQCQIQCMSPMCASNE